LESDGREADRLIEFYWVWSEIGPFEKLKGENFFLSAGSAYNNADWDGTEDMFKTWIPNKRKRLFVDSGGYTVAEDYNGIYPYSPKELMDWCEEVEADLVAGMDIACDSEDQCSLSFEERVQRTLDLQLKQVEIYESGGYNFNLIPIIQGGNTQLYEKSIDLMKEHGLLWDYIGVGSVCKTKAPSKIVEIIETVCDNIPSRVKLHLFGVKRSVLTYKPFWDYAHFVKSIDSGAWRWVPNEISENRKYPKDKEEKKKCLDIYRNKIEGDLAELSKIGKQKTLEEFH